MIVAVAALSIISVKKRESERFCKEKLTIIYIIYDAILTARKIFKLRFE